MRQGLEDNSLEEVVLHGIISSCENLLDDLEEGATIKDKDMKDLVYSDNVIMEIQQRVGEKFSPSNIKGGFYASNGEVDLIDDEHGNTLT